jgi:hypothetical protein
LRRFNKKAATFSSCCIYIINRPGWGASNPGRAYRLIILACRLAAKTAFSLPRRHRMALVAPENPAKNARLSPEFSGTIFVFPRANNSRPIK